MEALAGSPFFGFKTSRSLKLSRPNFTLPGCTHLSCTGHKGSTSNFGNFFSRSPKSCSIFASADIPIMVNDCSGKMGLAVAEAAVEAGLQLVPFCLTGPGMGQNVVLVKNVQIQVHETSEKEAILDKVLEMYPGVIIADYTLPSAVNENVEFYSRRGVPFVMGTTGGDRERLLKTVRDSGVYAVIAPQMGKQVVAFQAAMEIMAHEFPGAFAGYKLKPKGCQVHWDQCLRTEENCQRKCHLLGDFVGANFGAVMLPKLSQNRMDGYREEDSSSQDRQHIPIVHEVGEGSSQAKETFRMQLVNDVTLFKQLMENPRFMEFLQSPLIAHQAQEYPSLSEHVEAQFQVPTVSQKGKEHSHARESCETPKENLSVHEQVVKMPVLQVIPVQPATLVRPNAGSNEQEIMFQDTHQVTESHQSSKVDTSGTARAIVASFNNLGVSFKDEEIEMVRNPPEQISRMEVPEEHLKGHAFHTYSLTSPDGLVNFKFQHNVCGRSIYAQGTVDAVLFLARKVQEKATKKVYNMVDVLRGGSMR
ncbi:hypothetical protein L7F22_020133 [Adiantum nelumboides]|nr:hypothetical protein [Adiantum nelumboides]